MVIVSHPAGNGVPSSDRPTHELLTELLARLRGPCNAVGGEPRVALGVLMDRIMRLSTDQRMEVEVGTAPLRPALAVALEELEGRGELGRRGLRDVISLVRRLMCVVDRATSRGRSAQHCSDILTVHYSELDLADLVQRICASFNDLAHERSIDYDIRAPHELIAHADAGKVELAFLNLVFNAFKYTPLGGRIRCTLGEDASAEEVFFRVSDSGPGVTPGQAEQIFDHARQIDRSVFLTVDGIGFNLATSRDLLAVHGGTLTLDCRQRRGAAFEARLPTRAPAGLHVTGVPADQSSLAARVARTAAMELDVESGLELREVARDGRPLVLIVDDSRAIQRLLIESLESEYAIASALNGASGLARAIALEPDLILVDLGMPQPSGETLICAMRGREDLAEVPILVITGQDDRDQVVRLLETGVQDVLHKPFLLQELRARVRNLVSAKRTRDLLNETIGQHETDLVKLAAEVARRQEELETMLGQLEEARRIADSASRIKSNFLRMMSHELKTPVTAMQLQIQILERDPGVQLSPAIVDGFERIGRSTRRLMHLVDTILEWARVESGRCQLSVEEFDLSALVSEVVGELASYAKQKRIALALVREPGLPHVASDRRLVRLLLVNLISRAVQVTREGVVEISVLSSQRGHDIVVRDCAPPIPPDKRAELFDPLRGARDLADVSGAGSGLGLHVVRDIAHALDGNVALVPAEGYGNELVLSIPTLASDRTTTRILVRKGR